MTQIKDLVVKSLKENLWSSEILPTLKFYDTNRRFGRKNSLRIL